MSKTKYILYIPLNIRFINMYIYILTSRLTKNNIKKNLERSACNKCSVVYILQNI